MHIIFKEGINKNKQRSVSLVTVLLLITLTHSESCQPLTFKTSFTRCQITLDSCTLDSSIQQNKKVFTQYRFKQCQLDHCITLGASEECQNSVIIQLQQKNCYRSCCDSSKFNPEDCAANNLLLKSKSQTINGWLTIVLGVSALAILLTIACFIICKLKCFEHRKPPSIQPPLPIWRKTAFNDQKCAACDQYGAVIETMCHHWFHLNCYDEKVGEGEISEKCLVCKESSKKLRLWCNECHQKYLKVSIQQVKNIEELEVYYIQTKILHLDCLKDIESYMKTDIRLTSTTSQNRSA